MCNKRFIELTHDYVNKFGQTFKGKLHRWYKLTWNELKLFISWEEQAKHRSLYSLRVLMPPQGINGRIITNFMIKCYIGHSFTETYRNLKIWFDEIIGSQCLSLHTLLDYFDWFFFIIVFSGKPQFYFGLVHFMNV